MKSSEKFYLDKFFLHITFYLKPAFILINTSLPNNLPNEHIIIGNIILLLYYIYMCCNCIQLLLRIYYNNILLTANCIKRRINKLF